MNFIKILRKYKMDRKLQKMRLKNKFKSVNLGREPHIYIYNE